MSIQEFNAWLEGFTYSFKDGAPSLEQWIIIKEKIDSIFPGKK